MRALFEISHTKVEVCGPASHETIVVPHITVRCAKCGSKKTVKPVRGFRFEHCAGAREAIPRHIVKQFEDDMRGIFGA